MYKSLTTTTHNHIHTHLQLSFMTAYKTNSLFRAEVLTIIRDLNHRYITPKKINDRLANPHRTTHAVSRILDDLVKSKHLSLYSGASHRRVFEVINL